MAPSPFVAEVANHDECTNTYIHAGLLDALDLLKYVHNDYFEPDEHVANSDQNQNPGGAAEQHRGIHNLPDDDAKKCKLAFSLIQRAMEESQYHLVHNVTRGDCFTAWTKIAKRYARNTLAARLQIRQQFHSTTMESIPTTDVSVFIERLRSLAIQMKEMGEVVEKSDMLACLLHGLGEQFDPIVDIIEGIGSATFDDACDKISDYAQKLETAHREAKTAPITGLLADTRGYHKRPRQDDAADDSAYLAPVKRRPFRGDCYNCGKKGHRQAECRSKRRSRSPPRRVGKRRTQTPQSQSDKRRRTAPTEFAFNVTDSRDLAHIQGKRSNTWQRASSIASHVVPSVANGVRKFVGGRGRTRPNQKGGTASSHKLTRTVWQARNHPSKEEAREILAAAPSGAICVDSGASAPLFSMHPEHQKGIVVEKKWKLHRPLYVRGIGAALQKIEFGANVSFQTDVPGKDNTPVTHTIKIYDVNLANVSKNLLPVSRLDDLGFNIQFHRGVCRISKSGRLVAIAPKLNERLYHISVNIKAAPPRTTSTPIEIAYPATVSGTIDNKTTLWHRRLGHLSYSSLKYLQRNGLVDGLDMDLNERGDFCDACHLAASTRHGRGKSIRVEYHAEELGDVIHSDIKGPFPEPTLQGNKYFISFVDEKSRRSWTPFMHSRKEAFGRFKALHERFKTRGIPIKRLHSDNEFIKKTFKKFCEEEGIEQTTTPAHTPHRNGIAERLNRTLWEGALALLALPNLPLPFVEFALQLKNHVRNRSPCKPIGMTPMQAWSGKKPNIGYLRTFGCKSFSLIPEKLRRTGDQASTMCMYVGWDESRFCHLLWDLDKEDSFSSSNVGFDEACLTIWRDYMASKRSRYTLSEQVLVPMPEHGGPNVEHDAKYPDIDPRPPIPGTEVPSPEPDLSQNAASPEFAPAFDPASPHDTPPTSPSSSPAAPSLLDDSFNDLYCSSGEDYNLHNGLDDPAWTPTSDIIDHDEYKTGEPRPDRVTGRPGKLAEYYFVSVTDPKGWTAAMEGPQREQWLEAAEKELAVLRKSGTFEEVKLPRGAKLITGVWVFRTKLDENGDVDKFKARLCARGFMQIRGVHFDETFAPVAKLKSIRLILALAALLRLNLTQMDVVAAYLNGEIDDKHEIYMRPPPGYKTNENDTVLRIRKAIYGLKQAGRRWNHKLDLYLKSLGFKPTHADPSVYVRYAGQSIVILGVYVDDFIIADNDPKMRAKLKADLEKKFDMKDLGELKWILGMRVSRDSKGCIRVDQCQYTEQIINRFGMSKCNPVDTPVVPGAILTKADSDHDPESMKAIPYRSAVGALMYLMCGTRPDIATAVSRVSRHLETPTHQHWTAVKRIFRYLRRHSLGITYRGGASNAIVSVNLTGYADADYGNDPDTRRSTTGHVFMLAGGAISWESTRQRTVALSTTEAEYMALTCATKEAVWLRQLLKDLGFPQRQATRIWEDNQGCIALARNPVHHKRSKHIDIRYHFIRERVQSSEIDPQYVPSRENLADIFTKPLASELFTYLRNQILGHSRASPPVDDDQTVVANLAMVSNPKTIKRPPKKQPRFFTFSERAIKRYAGPDLGVKARLCLSKYKERRKSVPATKLTLPTHLSA